MDNERTSFEQFLDLSDSEQQCVFSLITFWECEPRQIQYTEYEILHFARNSPGRPGEPKFNADTAKNVMIKYEKNMIQYDLHLSYHIKQTLCYATDAVDLKNNSILYYRCCERIPKMTNKQFFNQFHRELQYMIKREHTSINGISLLVDCDNFSMRDNFSMETFKTFMDLISGGYPIRLRTCYVINTSRFFKPIYDFFRSFIPESLKEKFIVVKYITDYISKIEINKITKSIDIPIYYIKKNE